MNYAKQFELFVREALAKGERDVETINAPVEYSTAIVVYLTILQQSIDCALLLDHPSISAGAVLRGSLESYADLRAIIADPAYIDRMTATSLDQMRQLYENVIAKPANPYHADLASKMNVPAELASLNSTLEAYRKNGVKSLKPWERFKLAGLSYEHRSIYWSLCMESHNSSAAIQSRHITQGPSGLTFDLRRQPTDAYLLVHYDQLAIIVVDASLKIHELSNNTHVPSWVEMKQRLETLRAQLNKAYSQPDTSGSRS